jgi:VWFA-related protein
MNTRRCGLHAAFLLGFGWAAIVAGCGIGSVGGDDPGPVPEGPLVPDAFLSAAPKNLADNTTTRVTLTTSLDFDADANRVNIFALPKAFAGPDDIAGTVIQGLTRNSFSVILNAKNAPKSFDASSLTVDTETSNARLVGLVIDQSGSMTATVPGEGQTRMEVAKAAAERFVALMTGTDQSALVAFSTDARLAQQLTADQDALNAAIAKLAPEGNTNIGDAITEGVRAVGTRPGKRAVILLTDGGDTVDPVTGGPGAWNQNKDSKRYQALKLAKENGLPVYTVGFGLDVEVPTDDQRIAIDDLNFFASETGGTAFFVNSAAELERAFAETIPGEIDAMEPLETYRISFANPVTPSSSSAKRTVVVPVRTGVGYVTANGLFNAKFSGSYLVNAP